MLNFGRLLCWATVAMMFLALFYSFAMCCPDHAMTMPLLPAMTCVAFLPLLPAMTCVAFHAMTMPLVPAMTMPLLPAVSDI